MIFCRLLSEYRLTRNQFRYAVRDSLIKPLILSMLFVCVVLMPTGCKQQVQNGQVPSANVENQDNENIQETQVPEGDAAKPWVWFDVAGDQQPKAVAVLVHGRGQDPDQLNELVALFNAWKVNVLRVHLEGQSSKAPTGDPSLANWLLQVENAYNEAKARARIGEKDLPVFGVGYSLGGALITRLIQTQESVVFDKLALFAPAIAFTDELDRLMGILPLIMAAGKPEAKTRVTRLWGYLFGGDGSSRKNFLIAAAKSQDDFFGDFAKALNGTTSAWDRVRKNFESTDQAQLDPIMNLETSSKSYEEKGKVFVEADLALKKIANAMPTSPRRPLQKHSALILIDPEEFLISKQNMQSRVIEPLSLSQWQFEDLFGADHGGVIEPDEYPDAFEVLQTHLGLSSTDS